MSRCVGATVALSSEVKEVVGKVRKGAGKGTDGTDGTDGQRVLFFVGNHTLGIASRCPEAQPQGEGTIGDWRHESSDIFCQVDLAKYSLKRVQFEACNHYSSTGTRDLPHQNYKWRAHAEVLAELTMHSFHYVHKDWEGVC